MSNNNEIFGNRSVGEETVTDVGQFVVEEESITQEGTRQIKMQRSPYPDVTPKEMLSRWFYHNSETFSTPRLLTLSPWLAMMTSGTHYALQGVREQFLYMRSDIEVKLQLTSVAMQYGCMFVTEMPWYNMTAEKVMSNNPIVLDVSEPTEILVRIPWRSPDLYCKVNDGLSIAEASRQFKVFVNLPFAIGTIDTGVSSGVEMRIWYRFVEPELAGPRDPDTGIVEAQAFGGSNIKRTLATAGATLLTAYLGTQDMVGAVQELGASLVEAAVENEVDSDNAQFFKQSTYGDFVVRSKNVAMLSPKWDPGLETMDTEEEHDIHKWLSIPSFFFGQSFSAGETAFIAVYPDVNTAATRLGFVSRLARYWRGSIVYTLMFVTSPLVTARFAIGLALEGGTSPNLDVHPNAIVTVRGTTTVPIVVPFLFHKPWVVVGDTTFTPVLTVECMQITQSGSASAEVDMLSWVSAGPDFVFRSLKTPQVINTPAPVDGEFQSSIVELTQVNPLWLGASVPLKDYLKTDITTFESICRRTSYRNKLVGPTHVPRPWNASAVVNSNYDVFDYVSGIFLAYKGGVRHKIRLSSASSDTWVTLSDQNFTNSVSGIEDYQRFGGGAQAFDMTVNRVLELENAFVCSRDFVLLHHDWTNSLMDNGVYNPLYFTNGGSSILMDMATVSAGNDFKWIGICPTPPFDVWPVYGGDSIDKGKSGKKSVVKKLKITKK